MSVSFLVGVEDSLFIAVPHAPLPHVPPKNKPCILASVSADPLLKPYLEGGCMSQRTPLIAKIQKKPFPSSRFHHMAMAGQYVHTYYIIIIKYV